MDFLTELATDLNQGNIPKAKTIDCYPYPQVIESNNTLIFIKLRLGSIRSMLQNTQQISRNETVRVHVRMLQSRA
jgi:hypothetical protein